MTTSDRHVLAPAVAADCELIVTFDLADFPAPACEPLGMKAKSPRRAPARPQAPQPDAVRPALEQQRADPNPRWSVDELPCTLTAAVCRASAMPSAALAWLPDAPAV